MRFSASVDADASYRIHDRVRLLAWLTKRPGQRIEVELRDEAAIRSGRANRYWWAVCVETVRDCWQREKRGLLPLPKDFVHDALVGAFGGEWRDTPLGRARRSTTNMSVEDFSKLIEGTAEYLKDKYGCLLPKPEEWSEHA